MELNLVDKRAVIDTLQARYGLVRDGALYRSDTLANLCRHAAGLLCPINARGLRRAIVDPLEAIDFVDGFFLKVQSSEANGYLFWFFEYDLHSQARKFDFKELHFGRKTELLCIIVAQLSCSSYEAAWILAKKLLCWMQVRKPRKK